LSKPINRAALNSIDITQEELKKILNYSPETGVFKWRVSASSRAQVGDIAGCITGEGYRLITYNKCQYKAHRLAWVYIYGNISDKIFIDHVNGKKDDNSITNLRLCSNAENQRNVGISTRNTSGFKGVHLDKSTGNWRVRPTLNGKAVHVGTYKNKLDAVAAYRKFCIENHGEFYRDTRI
jgi:hypothetical protein